jgi:hypothetical protein
MTTGPQSEPPTLPGYRFRLVLARLADCCSAHIVRFGGRLSLTTTSPPFLSVFICLCSCAGHSVVHRKPILWRQLWLGESHCRGAGDCLGPSNGSRDTDAGTPPLSGALYGPGRRRTVGSARRNFRLLCGSPPYRLLDSAHRLSMTDTAG